MSFLLFTLHRALPARLAPVSQRPAGDHGSLVSAVSSEFPVAARGASQEARSGLGLRPGRAGELPRPPPPVLCSDHRPRFSCMALTISGNVLAGRPASPAAGTPESGACPSHTLSTAQAVRAQSCRLDGRMDGPSGRIRTVGT